MQVHYPGIEVLMVIIVVIITAIIIINKATTTFSVFGVRVWRSKTKTLSQSLDSATVTELWTQWSRICMYLSRCTSPTYFNAIHGQRNFLWNRSIPTFPGQPQASSSAVRYRRLFVVFPLVKWSAIVITTALLPFWEQGTNNEWNRTVFVFPSHRGFSYCCNFSYWMVLLAHLFPTWPSQLQIANFRGHHTSRSIFTTNHFEK